MILETLFTFAPAAITAGVAAYLVWKLRGKLDHRDDNVNNKLAELKDEITKAIHEDRMKTTRNVDELKAHVATHDRCVELISASIKEHSKSDQELREAVARLEEQMKSLFKICSKD